MTIDDTNRYDPLEKLLSSELAVAEPPAEGLVDEVLEKASNAVAVKDVLGLMLVNLWVVFAKMMMPLFVTHHGKSKTKE